LQRDVRGSRRRDPEGAANDALTLNITVPDGVEATVRGGNLTLAGRVPPRAHSAPPPIWRFPADRGTQRQGRHPDQLRYGPVGVTLLVPDALDRSALVADDSDVAANTDRNAVGLIGHVTPWAEMTR
jgi:hypothetical protein